MWFQFLIVSFIDIRIFCLINCHGTHKGQSVDFQERRISWSGWRYFSYSWRYIEFSRLLFSNVLHCFNNRVRWGLEGFNITRSSWTFRWCCNCWVRWWTFKSIIRRAAASPVRWSWWLFGDRCVFGRSCRLFAMRNSACFWLLISHREKVGYFRNATSHRSWNIWLRWGDPAARITLAVLHLFVPLLFSRKLFDMTFNQLLHHFAPDLAPLRPAYAFNGVCRSSCVPNLAISLFLTVTTGFPGSLMVEVVGLPFRIWEPGQGPHTILRSFSLIVVCHEFFARFKSTAHSLRGTGWVAFVRRKRYSQSLPSLSLALASCVARDIPFSNSMSLR